MKRYLHKLSLLCLPFLFMFAVVTQQAVAKPSAADLALAKKSEAYCAKTAKKGIATPKEILEKVEQAAKLIKKDGAKAYPKFKGKGSEYIFGGTYIWIHNLKGVMLMHPIKPHMVGKNLAGLKDGNGKRFFIEMNHVAREKGSGWIDYTWPKPGEKKRSNKVSYVKLVKTKSEEFVIGSGVYDLTVEDVKKELAQ